MFIVSVNKLLYDMKKIVIVLGFIILCFTGFAQQIEFANMAAITPPSRMQKLQQTEVKRITEQKLGKYPSLQNFLNSNSDNVYKAGDITILIKTTPKRPSDKLKAFKLGLQSIGPASIETVDGKNFALGLDSTKVDVVVYRFFCVNSSNTIQVAGLVTADLKDKDKAKSIIFELIKGIKFKVQ